MWPSFSHEVDETWRFALHQWQCVEMHTASVKGFVHQAKMGGSRSALATCITVALYYSRLRYARV